MVSALLDEGAGDLDSRAFHEKLEGKAIELRFRAGRDYFNGSLRMLNEHRDDAVELMRLALTAPRFETKTSSASAAKSFPPLQRDTTSPNAIASRRWWAAAFPGPSLWPGGQRFAGVVAAHRRRRSADLCQTRPGPRRTEDSDRRQSRRGGGRRADRPHFRFASAKADLQPVPMADAARPRPAYRGRPGRAADRHHFRPRRAFSARIRISWPPIFFNHILGGGTFSSRLYTEIREKRGLAYSIHDNLVWLKSTALMIGGTATRADRTARNVDRDRKRNSAHGGKRADGRGTRQGEILS